MLEIATYTTKCHKMFQTSYLQRPELSLDLSSTINILCICPFLLGF